MTRSPAEAVRGLWEVLDRRDYAGLSAWVTDDCIYLDAPLGPAFSARGPAGIAARLQVGWATSRRTRTTTACSSPTAST